jgi:hypothetical protein
MKKFLIVLGLILGTTLFLMYVYKGQVEQGSWGVLVLKGPGVNDTDLVEGMVFSLKNKHLVQYSKDLGHIRSEGADALSVRTQEGVVLDLEVGFSMRLLAEGAQDLAAHGTMNAQGHFRPEVNGVLLEHALRLASARTLGSILADPRAMLVEIHSSTASELKELGVSMGPIRPLRSPGLKAEQQDLMGAWFLSTKETEVAKETEEASLALERTLLARLRSKVDSTMAWDVIIRTDSLRLHDQLIARARTDSARYAMEFTSGYLESKRLDLLGKAIDKWDGRLAPDHDLLSRSFEGLVDKENANNGKP